jgi:hypothetical protein
MPLPTTTTTNSPLNLIERGPYGDRLANFRHYRGIEVKHGRTCVVFLVPKSEQELTGVLVSWSWLFVHVVYRLLYQCI